MTKEEIALQHGLCTCDHIYTSRGMKAPDCPWHARAVEEAMDAYARQEAIEFQNWVDKSEIVYDEIAKCYVKDDAFFCDTVDQLYDLYLTHKNKSDVNK